MNSAPSDVCRLNANGFIYESWLENMDCVYVIQHPDETSYTVLEVRSLVLEFCFVRKMLLCKAQGNCASPVVKDTPALFNALYLINRFRRVTLAFWRKRRGISEFLDFLSGFLSDLIEQEVCREVKVRNENESVVPFRCILLVFLFPFIYLFI